MRSLAPRVSSPSSTIFCFNDLPFEIKIHIYEKLVAKDFIALWAGYRNSAYDGDTDDSAICQGGRKDLSLLSVSKIIRAQALPILYSKGVFNFQIEHGYKKIEGPLLPKSVLDKVQNVQLDVHMIFNSGMRTRLFYYQRLRDTLLQHFMSSNSLRKTLVVRFTDYVVICPGMLSGAFFEGLHDVSGFKTLIIEIKSTRLDIFPDGDTLRSPPWKECAASLDEQARINLTTRYDALLSEMGQQLASTLGDSFPITDAAGVHDVLYARRLTFHPRACLVRDIKDKIRSMEAEVGRLTEATADI